MASDCKNVARSFMEEAVGQCGHMIKDIRARQGNLEFFDLIRERRKFNHNAHALARSSVYVSLGRHAWLLHPSDGFCITQCRQDCYRKHMSDTPTRALHLISQVKQFRRKNMSLMHRVSKSNSNCTIVFVMMRSLKVDHTRPHLDQIFLEQFYTGGTIHFNAEQIIPLHKTKLYTKGTKFYTSGTNSVIQFVCIVAMRCFLASLYYIPFT